MRALAAFAAALWAACAPRADAAQITLAPTLLEAPAARPVTSLLLRNGSDEPAAFSAAAFNWTQHNGEDTLNSAPEVIVSPPAFVIAPGREQVVRVGLPHAAPAASERAYRLIFTQTLLQRQTAGVHVRLRLSVPLFIAPDGPVDAPLGLAFDRKAASVSIENRANRRVSIAGASLGGAALPMPRYLLAGASVARGATGAGALRVRYLVAGANTLSIAEEAHGADAADRRDR